MAHITASRSIPLLQPVCITAWRCSTYSLHGARRCRDHDVACSSSWNDGPSTSRTSSDGGRSGGRSSSRGGRGGRGRGDSGARYPESGGRGDRRPSSQPPRQRAPSNAPAKPASTATTSFASLHARLQGGQQENYVISKDAWQRLFGMIATKDDADQTMALLLEDARVRDATSWDWITQGYGQTITELVKAAAAVGAFHVTDWVLEHAATLRVTIGKDTISDFMRKVASVQPDAVAGPELERLYQVEFKIRGHNTHAAFHEMSRVYRRAGKVSKVQSLLQTALDAGVPVKENIVTNLREWIQKRSG